MLTSLRGLSFFFNFTLRESSDDCWTGNHDCKSESNDHVMHNELPGSIGIRVVL
jgi:hypothetical protein